MRSEKGRRGPTANRLFGALALGLSAAYFVQRSKASPSDEFPGGSGNILSQMVVGVGQAVVSGFKAATDDFVERRRQLREIIAEGAQESGSIVIEPSVDPTLEIKSWNYGGTLVTDPTSSTMLSIGLKKSNFEGLTRMRPGEGQPATWYFKSSTGQNDTIAIVRGSMGPGWREDVGETIAITVDHVHPDSFFPYSDAMYAETFPLDRFAAMLNLAVRSERKKARREQRDIILVDRRESRRGEQLRLARSERRDEPRGYPLLLDGRYDPTAAFKNPANIIVLGEPDPAVRYDTDARKAVDRRTGWELTVRQVGSREETYQVATVSDGQAPIAAFTVNSGRGWRPDIGETRIISFSRIRTPHKAGEKARTLTEQEVPLSRLTPLLNAYAPFAWHGKNVGRFIIIDARANSSPEPQW